MQAVGNARAARIWEHNAPLRDKPTPDAPRERKEQWVRMIYERKQYLPPVPVDRTLSQQLVEAVLSRNIEQLLTVLPRCGKVWKFRIFFNLDCFQYSIIFLEIILVLEWREHPNWRAQWQADGCSSGMWHWRTGDPAIAHMGAIF